MIWPWTKHLGEGLPCLSCGVLVKPPGTAYLLAVCEGGKPVGVMVYCTQCGPEMEVSAGDGWVQRPVAVEIDSMPKYWWQRLWWSRPGWMW